jgi:hypothetical protein
MVLREVNFSNCAIKSAFMLFLNQSDLTGFCLLKMTLTNKKLPNVLYNRVLYHKVLLYLEGFRCR